MTARYASFSDWVAHERFLPQVDVHPLAGGSGSLFRVRQDQAVSDPATPDLLIQLQTAGTIQGMVDYGAGRIAFEREAVGGLAICPPDVPLVHDVEGRSAFTVLAVPARIVTDTLAGAGRGLPDLGRLYASLHRDDRLTGLLGWLERDVTGGSPHGALFADSVVNLVIVRLLELAQGLAPWDAAPRLPETRLARAAEALRANLARDVGLAEIAAAAGMSTFHFSRRFAALFGMSPHQYRIMARIEAAQHLLCRTRLSVAEIACLVGYTGVSRFGVHFKARVGTTPSAWRAL